MLNRREFVEYTACATAVAAGGLPRLASAAVIPSGACTNFARSPDVVIAALLPRLQGKNVWDLGCGDGHFLSRAATVAASVTGVEIDPTLAATAAASLASTPKATVLQGDFFSLGTRSAFVALLGTTSRVVPLRGSLVYANLGKPCTDGLYRLNKATGWRTGLTLWSLDAYLIDWEAPESPNRFPPDEQITVHHPRTPPRAEFPGEMITRRLFRYGS